MTVSAMNNIGDRLKKARESKSLTIDQVQKQTRIHSSVLIALEEGRCDKMLTPTYVKSFLKKYSTHLGLDQKELIGDYLAAHPELRAQETPSVTQPKAEGESSKRLDLPAVFNNLRPYIAIAAVVFFAVLFIGITAKFLIDRNRVRIVVASKGPDAKPGKTRISDKTVKTTTAQKQTAPKETAPKENTPKETPSTKPSSSSGLLVPKNQPITLVIKARQGVFVSAVADGEQVFRKHIPKGRDETVTADDSIKLYIARGESVSLYLNGKPITVKKGAIKDLVITRKGVQAR